MRALVLVAVAGCWTGGTTASEPLTGDQAPAAPVASRGGFKVKLERTACMGACPTYSLVIHADGRVDWDGHANVLAFGQRRGRVTPEEIAELDRLVTTLRFFERDESGHLPIAQQCVTAQNGVTSCSMAGSFSFCSDTSHTVITVTRNHKTHRVDNANCGDDDELAGFEQVLDRIVNVRAWVDE